MKTLLLVATMFLVVRFATRPMSDVQFKKLRSVFYRLILPVLIVAIFIGTMMTAIILATGGV